MTNPILLTRRRIAERYDRSIQTVKRWERDGIVPPPDLFIIDEPAWYGETAAVIDANLNAATTGRAAGQIKGRANG
jgi:hypothetical protein